MQREFDAMTPNPGIQILGVNQVGQERDNNLMCDGKDIPWLQETMTEFAWIPWHVTWRDVVILDEANRKVAVYNLTTHSLGTAANYQELRTMLLNTKRTSGAERAPTDR